MRLAAVSLATLCLLLSGPVSHAQAPANQAAATRPAPPQTVVRPSGGGLGASRSCPVSLDVRHGWGLGQAVATDGSSRPVGQALDLTVTNHNSREIASLDGIVQVRSGKSRMMPLVSENDELGERLPLHIDVAVKADEVAAASWNVASMHAVAYVELNKVTYRDGSSWSSAKGTACQFTPNPLMLISSR